MPIWVLSEEQTSWPGVVHALEPGRAGAEDPDDDELDEPVVPVELLALPEGAAAEGAAAAGVDAVGMGDATIVKVGAVGEAVGLCAN